VGHITEAQRAAGGARITAMGVTDTAGSNAAGTVRVQVVGTGTASNASFWTTNNFAYITAGVPAISMAGYASLVVHWQIVPTDLRAAFAALTFSVFEVDQVTGADHWVLNSNLYAANSQINLQGIFGSAARPGSPGVKLLIDTHPGVPINMWYERF